MSRVALGVLRRSLLKPCGARALYSASHTLPATADIATPQLDWSPFSASEVAALDRWKHSFEGRSATSEHRLNCLRTSTAAVATRLTQQAQFPLLPGTPFTVDGATTVNPLKQPRLIATLGPEPRIVFANEEWTQLCGYTNLELQDTNAYEALTGPGTDSHAKQMIGDAFDRQARVQVTVINFAKDGTPYMMQLQLSPLLSKNGDVSHILASVKHI